MNQQQQQQQGREGDTKKAIATTAVPADRASGAASPPSTSTSTASQNSPSSQGTTSNTSSSSSSTSNKTSSNVNGGGVDVDTSSSTQASAAVDDLLDYVDPDSDAGDALLPFVEQAPEALRTIVFTYDVEFREAPEARAQTRWEHYSSVSTPRAHWWSFLTSLGCVALLSCLVALVIRRVLHRDIAANNQEEVMMLRMAHAETMKKQRRNTMRSGGRTGMRGVQKGSGFSTSSRLNAAAKTKSAQYKASSASSQSSSLLSSSSSSSSSANSRASHHMHRGYDDDDVDVDALDNGLFGGGDVVVDDDDEGTVTSFDVNDVDVTDIESEAELTETAVVAIDLSSRLDAEASSLSKGWKMVHGEVFRPPKNAKLLAILVGTGTQVSRITMSSSSYHIYYDFVMFRMCERNVCYSL